MQIEQGEIDFGRLRNAELVEKQTQKIFSYGATRRYLFANELLGLFTSNVYLNTVRSYGMDTFHYGMEPVAFLGGIRRNIWVGQTDGDNDSLMSATLVVKPHVIVHGTVTPTNIRLARFDLWDIPLSSILQYTEDIIRKPMVTLWTAEDIETDGRDTIPPTILRRSGMAEIEVGNAKYSLLESPDYLETLIHLSRLGHDNLRIARKMNRIEIVPKTKILEADENTKSLWEL